MRLIDAKELKDWVQGWFTMNRHYHPYSKQNNIPIPELYDILERMPTIEVTRCRDCTHRNGDYCHRSRDGYSRFIHYDDFCSYGEKEET